MSLRLLHLLGSPVLRQRSAEVGRPDDEVTQLVEDMLGLRLISLHNIRFLVRLGEQARAHILAGTFQGWSREWLRRYHARAA